MPQPTRARADGFVAVVRVIYFSRTLSPLEKSESESLSLRNKEAAEERIHSFFQALLVLLDRGGGGVEREGNFWAE